MLPSMLMHHYLVVNTCDTLDDNETYPSQNGCCVFDIAYLLNVTEETREYKVKPEIFYCFARADCMYAYRLLDHEMHHHYLCISLHMPKVNGFKNDRN